MTTMVGNDEQQKSVADDDGSKEEGRVERAMVMAMRVACNEEG
jgi:hypothetical protein